MNSASLAESSAPPILEMVDVAVPSLHSPNLVVVEQVSWTVQRGEYWVLGGRPVSGKSDFLTTAAGLMRPRGGLLRLFGQDVSQLREEERLRIQRRIGFVFGGGGRLFSHLSLAENLALPLCYHENCASTDAHPRVQEVLELMELTAMADRRPVEASRNVRQRAALARALILGPEFLLLDNPLAGVDPREARWFLNFLDALSQGHPILARRPLTMVVATDDLLPWKNHGRQFALLDRARFVRAGTWDALQRETSPALHELLQVEPAPH